MAEFSLEEAYGIPTAKPKGKQSYTPLQQVMPVAPQAAPQTMPLQSVLSPKSQEAFNLEQAKRSADQASAPPGAAFMEKAQKLKDFEGYLNDYKDELKKDLTVFPTEIPLVMGAKVPLPVGSDTARMKAKYNALLMGVKDAYQLGALTGPDMNIVEAQITNPASISGIFTSRDAMNEQVKVLNGILGRAKQNLESSYGKKMDFGTSQGGGSLANDPLGIRPRKP